VEIGDRVQIGDHAELYSLGPITIGSDSIISQRSYLCAGTHNFRDVTFPLTTAPIIVEDQVWIASDVFVAPGITIGRGAVIGVRSTVLHNIAPAVVAFGTPAKPVAPRRSGTVDKGAV
jgi:putative colanic acid biosynthesis acetyltransferase WcaF